MFYDDVPVEWVFETYLGLTEKLQGQNVKIKSPFNPADNNPSAFVYYDIYQHRYRFKDFSTGKFADADILVMELLKFETVNEAREKILTDYKQWLKTNKQDVSIITPQERFKVAEYNIRKWSETDAKFWTKYNISSKLLEHYQIKPLEYYKLRRGDDELHIELNVIYGYFKIDGTLFKIYTPYRKDNKFTSIERYIQGTEQLTLKKRFLVITSSMKDLLSLLSLGYSEIESIAPPSENTIIPKEVIAAYKMKYEKIITLFDNDQPGIDSMKRYKELYDLDYCHLPMSKDLSDSIKDHGALKVKEILTPLLKTLLL